LEYLHLIYVNPNIRIFIGTGRKELAHAILREIKQYLIDPQTQDEVWNNRPHYPGERLIPVMERSAGMSARKQAFQNERLWDDEEDRDDYDYQSSDKKIVWSRDQIQVCRDLITKDPTIGVGSAGSASTGFHYDLIHIDDMIDFTNYDREDKKAKIDLWKDDLFSLLDPAFFDTELHDRMKDLRPKNARVYQQRAMFLAHTGDEVAVNGTRYFVWDWYEELKEKATQPDSEWLYFEKNVYKNGLDNSDGYLWSERWNSKIEKSKRESINDRHWYAQYLNQILVSSDQCLVWDNVKFFPPNALVKEKGSNYWLIKFGDSTDSMRIFPKLCIDPAASASKTSDYTAIAIGGQTEDFRLVVFDVRYGKWTPEDWAKQAIELAEKLIALAPGNHEVISSKAKSDGKKKLTRVFYSDSGSEAVEIALKMAYQYWQQRVHCK
jgi:hypothetical protein